MLKVNYKIFLIVLFMNKVGLAEAIEIDCEVLQKIIVENQDPFLEGKLNYNLIDSQNKVEFIRRKPSFKAGEIKLYQLKTANKFKIDLNNQQKEVKLSTIYCKFKKPLGVDYQNCHMLQKKIIQSKINLENLHKIKSPDTVNYKSGFSWVFSSIKIAYKDGVILIKPTSLLTGDPAFKGWKNMMYCKLVSGFGVQQLLSLLNN